MAVNKEPPKGVRIVRNPMRVLLNQGDGRIERLFLERVQHLPGLDVFILDFETSNPTFNHPRQEPFTPGVFLSKEGHNTVGMEIFNATTRLGRETFDDLINISIQTPPRYYLS